MGFLGGVIAIEEEKMGITINRTVEILFGHLPSRTYSVCKVDIGRLNWKLRKLQNEGMYILGVLLLKEVDPIDVAMAPGINYPPLEYYPPSYGKTDTIKDIEPPIILNDASDKCTDEAVIKEENGC